MAKTGKTVQSDPAAELARLQARVNEAPSAYHKNARQQELSGFLAQHPELGGGGGTPAAAPAGNQPSPAPPLPAPFGPTGVTNKTPLNTAQDITNAQAPLNQQYISQQLALNRPSEVNPYGTSTYYTDPTGRQIRVSGIGNVSPEASQAWTGEQFQNQSYIDRALQAIAGEGGANNQGMAGYLGQLRQLGATPFDYSGITALPSANDYGADRQRIEDSIYNQYSSVFEPQFQKERSDFEQQMADRGIAPGNAQYTKLLDDLTRRQNEQRQQIRGQAIQEGGQEQQRLFENTVGLRSQGIKERLQQRQQPLSEFSTVLGLVNPYQQPQFSGMSNVAVPQNDLAGAALNLKGLANQLAGIKLQGENALAVMGLQGENAQSLQQLQGQQQQQLQQNQFQNQQNLLNQQQNQNRGNFWGNILGSVGSGLAAGLGSSLFGGKSNNSGGGFFSNIF